jgi:hypothetical protein
LQLSTVRAISRSLLSTSSSSTASNFVENLENLVPSIPSYARTEFRQSNDSILSTSPNSGEYDVTESEDSPMVVETSSRSGAGQLAAVSDHLTDVEEYSLDIVAHMKKVEVRVYVVTKHLHQEVLPYWFPL